MIFDEVKEILAEQLDVDIDSIELMIWVRTVLMQLILL